MSAHMLCLYTYFCIHKYMQVYIYTHIVYIHTHTHKVNDSNVEGKGGKN